MQCKITTVPLISFGLSSFASCVRASIPMYSLLCTPAETVICLPSFSPLITVVGIISPVSYTFKLILSLIPKFCIFILLKIKKPAVCTFCAFTVDFSLLLYYLFKKQVLKLSSDKRRASCTKPLTFL